MLKNRRATDQSTPISRLRICLISAVPPPLGGIGRWTTILHRWAASDPLISIVQVDVSPRWRAIDDLSVWKRVIGGGLQLVRDYGRFLAAARGAHVVHLATSGRLAVVRDLAICVTARVLRLPVVYHLHFGRVPEIARTKTLEWRMLLRAMRLADVVLPLDEATASTVCTHLPHQRVEVAPNSIDPALLPVPSPERSAKKSLLFLGWLLPSKGVEDLLAAWRHLDIDDWELVIAGPGTAAYQSDLISRFSPRNIRFIGEVSHDAALQLIADCDVFVLPSHTEGFPFVILEALALGKAIVATNVGAIPQLLAEGCGLLVESKDVQGLATALRKLVDDDTLRERLGDRARERALTNYTTDKVFARLRSIWRSLE